MSKSYPTPPTQSNGEQRPQSTMRRTKREVKPVTISY